MGFSYPWFDSRAFGTFLVGMPESAPVNPAEPGLEVSTSFVRNRNVLIAQTNFTDLYVDYYLHLADQRMKPAPGHDTLFKRALAGFVLHSATRPWNEITAWTINIQDPLVNLFLAGDNDTGAVTGRIFDENVKVLPENLFYADVVRGNEPKRRSTVAFQESDPLAGLAAFYARSEQRLARLFDQGGERFALVIEHPDCDLAWLRGLTSEQLAGLEGAETVVPLERRVIRWHCGCNQPRMLQVLAPAFKASPGDLFGDGETLEIRCPRCGARHNVTREALEAYMAGQG